MTMMRKRQMMKIMNDSSCKVENNLKFRASTTLISRCHDIPHLPNFGEMIYAASQTSKQIQSEAVSTTQKSINYSN